MGVDFKSSNVSSIWSTYGYEATASSNFKMCFSIIPIWGNKALTELKTNIRKLILHSSESFFTNFLLAHPRKELLANLNLILISLKIACK